MPGPAPVAGSVIESTDSVPSVVPTGTKLTLWVSVRSTSSKLKVPLVPIEPVSTFEPSSATPPVNSSPAMIGASLLPVMVTRTVAVSLSGAPLMSVTVTVKSSTLVSPTAR